MPIEGNAYAAFVTDLEKRLRVDGESQVLTFPEFTLRIGLDDLLFEASKIVERAGMDPALAQREALLNQEDFAVLVNQVPQASTTFLGDGRMVWAVYDRVLAAPEIPILASDQAEVLQAAQLFESLRLNFSLAERSSVSGDGARFYPTSTLPPDDVTDRSAWTRVVLDQARIDLLSRETTTTIRDWMKQRGLMDIAETAGVRMASLTVEIFPLTIHRPWFEPDLFHNRLWRWQEGLLSDGGVPPRGLLPAFISRIVLARNLQIELELQEPLSTAAGLAKLKTAIRPLIIKKANLKVNNVAAPVARPLPEVSQALNKSKIFNLRQFTKMTAQQDPSGKRSLNLGPLDGSSTVFPMPSIFISNSIQKQIIGKTNSDVISLTKLSNERAALSADITQLGKRVKSLDAQIRRFPPTANTVTIRDHTGGKVVEKVLDLRAMRKQLASLELDLKAKKEELARKDRSIAVLNGEINDLKGLLEHYKSLSQSTADESDIFILCFVCTLVPKSPDPDPRFFPK